MPSKENDGWAYLLSQINANWTSAAISVTCRLGLPELLAAGPQSVEALAKKAHCHAPSLLRLLDALAALGICKVAAGSTFALTPTGHLLRQDKPSSLRAWALLCGGPHWSRWGELELTVRTGQSFAQRREGAKGFAQLGSDVEIIALYHRAMADLTGRVAQEVLPVIDVSSAKQIVDVGGGSGGLLAAILAKQPSANGILFDQPQALANARAVLELAGLADRCSLVAGSFFESIPAGADLYLLKSVLHNWDDADGARILHNCRRAMQSRAKLLVVERVVQERIGTGARDRSVARSDLNMLIALGGRERRKAEFRTMFAVAGLRLNAVRATKGEFVVIEARPD